MDTCFEVAKSKTNLAADIVADWEIALYDCYCFQAITQVATIAGLKTFQAKLLVVVAVINITLATFHKDLWQLQWLYYDLNQQNWVD